MCLPVKNIIEERVNARIHVNNDFPQYRVLLKPPTTDPPTTYHLATDHLPTNLR